MFAWALSFGTFRLGSFAWRLALGTVNFGRILHVVKTYSGFENGRLGNFAETFRLGNFVRDLSPRTFRLGLFALNLTLGIEGAELLALEGGCPRCGNMALVT